MDTEWKVLITYTLMHSVSLCRGATPVLRRYVKQRVGTEIKLFVLSVAAQNKNTVGVRQEIFLAKDTVQIFAPVQRNDFVFQKAFLVQTT